MIKKLRLFLSLLFVITAAGMTMSAQGVARIGQTGYATLEEAFAAATDGSTITLLSDCSGNGIKVPQGKYTQGLTVDFGGFTYTMDGNLVGSSGTETQAFQLLKDNNITFRNGTITSQKAKMLVQNYSNLTLDGMTLTMNNPDYANAYTLSNNNGNVTIKDSHIVANPAGAFAFDVCRYASYPEVHVTVTGNSVIDGNIEISASGNDAKDGFSLNLNGGTLTGNIVLDSSAKAAMAATPDKAVVKQNDTFNADAPAGYIWQSNGDGTSTLGIPVAQIERDGVNIQYRTLEEAFAAANDGETIVVLRNCSGNGIKVPQGKYTQGLTVDFGGFTYTVDGDLVGSTGTETQAFQLLKDNNITFKNGTITSEKAKMLVQNYSNLTLNGMTLTLNNANYANAYTLSNNNGNVVINNTTINANPAGRFAFDVCRYSSYPSVSVTVTGTSVINGDIEVSASGSDAKDGFLLYLEEGTLTGNIVLDSSAKAAMAATPDKAVVKQNDTFNADAPAGYIWQSNGDGTSTLGIPVAQIERDGVNIQYRTLEEAFAAANDGETIVVLTDCSGNGIKVPQGKYTQGLTVDFGGFTYTMDGNLVGSSGTETQAFQLLKDNNITFRNGTITSQKAKMLVQNYSNLTLNGMTLTLNNANYANAYTLSNNNGNVVINNTTINANPAGRFAFDVCRYSSYPSVSVTVTGTSVINGDIEVSASGNDAKDGFSLNLNGGTLNGNIVLDASAEAAMAATPDKAVVKQNDTFNADAPAGYIWQSNGDGTSTLEAIPPVASIGAVNYATLQEAVDAVPADGENVTITMLQTANLESFVTTTGQNITFDMNGKRVNLTTPAQIVAGSSVTLSGSGMLGINDNDATAPLINNYGTLTMAGAQVLGLVTGKDGSTTNVNSGSQYMTLVGESGATVNIAGNTSQPRFNAGSVTAKSGSTFNITGGDMRVDFIVEDGANVTISNGYFKTKIKKEWCASGYVPTIRSALTGNSPYGVVKEADAWAKLVTPEGDEFYYTQYMVGTALNNYSSDGDRIVLLVDHSTKSFSINFNNPSNKSVTLDLNGFSLKAMTVWYGDVTVVNGTVLQDIDLYSQVQNSGKVSNLTIGADCTVNGSNAAYGIVLWPEDDNNTNTGFDANLTVYGTINNGVFVQGNLWVVGNSVINVEDGGKVINDNGVAISMNGYATVNVKEGATVTGSDTGIEVRAGELNVTGGTITGGSGTTSVTANASGTTTHNAGIAISQHTTQLPITVNVSDGEINATTALYIVNPQENGASAGAINVQISGDEDSPNFNGHTTIEDARADLEISGGYFDDPVRPQDCADGYQPMGPLSNDKYTVGIPVAQIERDGVNIQYRTLEEAFAAANDGETIVVLRNCSGNGIKVPQGKYTQGLTVDFGGFTYTVDGDLVGSTGTETQAFQLLRDNNITFKNGTITSEKAKMLVQNYSNLTLNGMTLTLNNANYANAYTLSNNNGNVVINNTTINANPAGRFAFDVCRYASYPSVSVTVTGTSVINGDIEVSASGSDAKDGFLLYLQEGTLTGNIVLDSSAKAAMAATPEKAVVREKDTFNATAPAGYIWKSEGDGNSVLSIHTVARINTTYYPSLASAVAAAQEGDTVVMIDNSNETATAVVTNAITIDLNGKTVTRAGLALNVQADLTVTDNSANGGGSAPAPARYLRNAEDSETSATQGSIQATGGSGIVAQVTNGATLTLDNVTVHAGNRVVNLINGHLITQNDVTMTSDFMILMSSTTSTNTITINGGTYTGATVGFVVYAGSLTINDGEIVSNNDTAVIFDDGQGFGCDTFTLNDGTLTSARSYAVYLKAGVKGIINDGTINGTAGIVIMNSNYSTTLEFNDGTINSTGFGITNNGQTTANDATTITINGGKINAENVGIYHPGVGNLTITGGEIVGSTGVVLRNGKLSMTGGTIHGTAADKEYDYYDGGSTNTGEGLLIERSNYGDHFGETFNGEEYKGTQVDITYGIFISDHADAVHSYIKGDDTTQEAEEGVERVLNFLNDGWYSNIIPQEHVVEGKYRDENPRSTSPDPRARWTLKSPEPTGISEVLADGKTVEGYYAIDGVRHDRPVKGINIVRFTDNTSKKVILR